MLRHCLTALFAAAPLLAGCAGSTPDFAQRLEAESGAVAAIGRDWREGADDAARGRALIDEGEERLERGEDLAEEGRRMIRRGESLLRSGTERQRGAEERYRRREDAADA